MTTSFEIRLNKTLDRLLSKDLLANEGLGNEIGFYIFDYPADRELQVRDYLPTILDQISKQQPDLKVCHINLFELLVEYLDNRKLLAPAFKLQKSKGNTELLKALKGPLHEQKVAKYFVEKAKPDEHDLILLSGIGSSWPILRSHTLLNSLHHLVPHTPLVMFYPGEYDGQGLKLFGKLKETNYYRAFRLVS